MTIFCLWVCESMNETELLLVFIELKMDTTPNKQKIDSKMEQTKNKPKFLYVKQSESNDNSN